MKQLENILVAITAFLVQGWILKALWNVLAPAQGLQPISWLNALGWMIAARILFGTGDIASTLKRGANK